MLEGTDHANKKMVQLLLDVGPMKCLDPEPKHLQIYSSHALAIYLGCVQSNVD